jgi:2-polyprenyl-3-methyl-5-hydroxy-6-metoxy-1,4-benzoquinol methylase
MKEFSKMASESDAVDPARYPDLSSLMQLQYERTPAHRKYLEARLSHASADSLPMLEVLAKQIRALAGSRLPDICDNYDFICKIVREEEMFFRRHGKYRLENFADANRLVYSDTEYMGKYMDGLLLTQIYWSNHSASYRFYKEVFLGNAPKGYDYLEIGPGHGLLLYQAISDEKSGSVTGWDLSEASINHTREALKMLGVRDKHPSLVLQDLYTVDDNSAKFDCITFSEVLEHLEDPNGALIKLRSLLKPDGRLFVNVPINSPAPDHLYLLRSPEEAIAAVRDAGFEIEHAEFYPMTNHTMEQARKHQLTISACIIARRST